MKKIETKILNFNSILSKEYKNPEDHRIAACIYTFPDILLSEDEIKIDELKLGSPHF